VLEEIARRLKPETHELSAALASLPEQIRGFGPVKLASIEKARLREKELLEALRGTPPGRREAA
jgi:indolepyruvate ferredoxin oxidoreductase